MRQICVVGPVDKRGIVYPMFKALDQIGKTLVLTDDSNFRRFDYPDFGTDFEVGRSQIVVVPEVTKELLSERVQRGSTYEFVVCVTTNTIFEEMDKIVYCHGLNKAICGPEELMVFENIEHDDLYITPNGVGEKKVAVLGMNKNVQQYVWGCEEAGMFLPCKDTELTKFCATYLAPVLNLQRDQVAKILARSE